MAFDAGDGIDDNGAGHDVLSSCLAVGAR
jgi:hypothetical protein